MNKKIGIEYRIPRPYTKLGEYLQSGREKAGLTQKEVAEELEYSTAQFISNFERGIAAPPLRKLKRIIEMYSISPQKVMNMILEHEKERTAEILFDKPKAA